MKHEKAYLLRLPVQFFAEGEPEAEETSSPDTDEELLSELCAEEEPAEEAEEAEEADFGGGDDEWIAFVRDHPDVSELPAQVVQRVAAGQPLRYAYTMYENEQLRCRLAILSQNSRMAQKSPGSLLSEEGDTGVDPFLQGLLGDRG